MINNLSNPINLHKNLSASANTKNKPKYPLKSTYKLPTCTITKKLKLPYIRPFVFLDYPVYVLAMPMCHGIDHFAPSLGLLVIHTP